MYYLISQRKKKDVAKTPVVSSIVPGQAKAILTLSDGRKVALDSAIASTIAEGNVTVQNKNGQLNYTSVSGSHKENVFNTLSTTVGQIYSTVLSDGSKIYLNSLSSIRYPVVFNSSDRVVEITGEAYFEVAHDKSRPFRVSINGNVVEVTGTSFNIQGYDTSQIKTTLLEGGVKIIPSHSGGGVKFLKPGQQAKILKKNVSVRNDADVEEVLAWKNGMFIFNGTDIKDIMRELQRWYNVEVKYATDVTGLTFTGQISKYDQISRVIEYLELTQKLHFKLEGRTVVISKYK